MSKTIKAASRSPASAGKPINTAFHAPAHFIFMVNTQVQINKVRYKKIRQWWLAYRIEKGCQICGWKEHPEILQAHHIVPLRRKTAREQSSFLGDGESIEKLKTKLKGILILCPNCHRWHHHKDNNQTN